MSRGYDIFILKYHDSLVKLTKWKGFGRWSGIDSRLERQLSTKFLEFGHAKQFKNWPKAMIVIAQKSFVPR